MPPADVILLGRRLIRRKALMQWSRNAFHVVVVAAGLALIVSAFMNFWMPSTPLLGLGMAWSVVTAAVLAGLWIRTKPIPSNLLVAADRQIGGQQLLTTAYELATDHPNHPFLPLMYRRCEPLIQRVNEGALVPLKVKWSDITAVAFVCAAIGIFLFPGSLLVMSKIPNLLADALVIEEGRSLEKLSAHLKSIAQNEGYDALNYLADAIREQSRAFQSGQLSRDEAAQQLELLAALAHQLQQMSDRTFMTGADSSNGSNPSAESQYFANDARRLMRRGMGAEPIKTADKPPETEGTAEEPLSEDATTAPPDSDGQARGIEDQILPQAESRTEQELLKSAELNLQEATETFREKTTAQNENLQSDPDKFIPGVLDGLKSKGAGGYQQEPVWASAQDMGWEIPPQARPSDTSSIDGETKVRTKSRTPDLSAFEDRRLHGLDAEGEVQVRWVRKRPEDATRKIQAEGNPPVFQAQITAVQEKSNVPHAYRSIVKSYRKEMERIAAFGE